jgi:hypothetical protein
VQIGEGKCVMPHGRCSKLAPSLHVKAAATSRRLRWLVTASGLRVCLRAPH